MKKLILILLSMAIGYASTLATASIRSTLEWSPVPEAKEYEAAATLVGFVPTNGIIVTGTMVGVSKLLPTNLVQDDFWVFHVRTIASNGLKSDWASITGYVGRIPVMPRNLKLNLNFTIE